MGEPDWQDWSRAKFQPLSSVDPPLAEHLTDRLVDRLLSEAGLSAVYRDQARVQVVIDTGITPNGVRILRVRLPLGEGEPEYGWDGSALEAEEIVDSMARVAADTINADRTAWGVKTSWDQPPDEQLPPAAVTPAGVWAFAPLTGDIRHFPGRDAEGLDTAATVKLMPEYSVHVPLWGEWKGLGLSASLLRRLIRWQKDFDGAFHWDTGWRSPEARETWAAEAGVLEGELRREVGDRAIVTVNLWPLEG